MVFVETPRGLDSCLSDPFLVDTLAVDLGLVSHVSVLNATQLGSEIHIGRWMDMGYGGRTLSSK